MANWKKEIPDRAKLSFTAGLVGICILFTYYHHVVLKVETVFTHLYYLPVIFACMWWSKKGLWVAVCLAAVLIFSTHVLRPDDPVFTDYARTFFLLITGYVVATLSEGIAREKKKNAIFRPQKL